MHSVFTAGANISLITDAFVSDVSGSGGGAVEFDYASNALVANSTFINGSAGKGGAVHIDNSNAVFSDDAFTGNTADAATGGGASAFTRASEAENPSPYVFAADLSLSQCG